MLKFSRRPADRPDELLRAALARFREVGFAQAKVEEIAAAAGVTVGTVYRYFPGKEALVEALVQKHLDPEWSRGREITEAYGSRTPHEVLALVLRRLAASLLEPDARDVLLLVVREAHSFPKSVESYTTQLLGRGCLAVERALRHGIEREEFALLPIEATARAMVGAVLQQVIWDATFAEYLGPPRDAEAQTALTIAMLVRGLPRPDREPRPDPAPSTPLPPAEPMGRGRFRIVTLTPPGRD